MKKQLCFSINRKKHQVLLIMKIIFTIIILSINLSFASNGYSQNEQFSVNIKQKSVREVFATLEKSSGYRFFYNDDFNYLDNLVSVEADKMSLNQILDGIFKQTDFEYKILDKKLVVVSIKEELLQARIKISGKVTDQDGQPMYGVTVSIKGTQKAVLTDANGSFSMEVLDKKATLVFSYIGFLIQEHKLTGESTVNIVLVPSIKSLDEVVVIGYGTQKKADVTSSVATVKSNSFIKGSVVDAGQLIQGKVAGLAIISPNGDPTSTTQILLRGQTTLMGANQNPFVLIDGVPGDMKTVAPQDIESIDVLKDGSAAAIYGTRGTNGVIIITTKKATGDNKNTVEYSSYLSTQTIARKLDLSTAADFRAQITAGYRAANSDLKNNTDWLKEITQTPLSQVHNLTVRGGSSTSNYLVNVNYNNTDGMFKKSYNQVFSGRAEFNQSMFDDKVKINVGIFNSSTKFNGFNGYIYRQSVIQNPTAPVKNPDGTWFQEISKFEYENPVSDLMESNGVTNDQNSRFKSSIIYTPIKDLKLSGVFSYNKWNRENGYSETKQHISTLRDGRNGYASVGGAQSIDRLVELTADYTKSINNHNFMILGGYSYQENDYQNMGMTNWDLPTDLFGYSTIQNGNALKNGLAGENTYKAQTNLIGFFTRFTYNYKDKYLFMGSLRHEAASQLYGAKKPWGTFPSVSVGWRITKESFMSNLTIFNDLKLRVGYGVTGSQPDALFLGVGLIGYSRYVYSNGKWLQTLIPTQNPNPELKWEEKHETNFGLDFSILKNRIGGSIDVYNRQIQNLLFNYAVPSPPNLYNNTIANVGKMENRGLEIMLNFVPLKTKDFEWTSSISYSTNTNKLVSLSNDLYKASSDYFTVGYTGPPVQTFTHLVKIGGKVGDFYGFKVIDIGNDATDAANYGQWVYEGSDGKPVKYKDFKHAFEDKKVIGNGLPQFYAGWNNNFKYKNWDLSITQRGAFKFQIANFQRMMYENPTYTQYNLLKTAFNKVYGKTLLKSPQELNSYYIENGDYWKIDNITLGYNINKTGIKYIQSARIFVSTLNTFIFTGYKGIDPEVSLRNGVSNAQAGINVIPTSGLDPGIDSRDKYPTTRTFSIGINVTF
jgi:TonB-linked SusC/RagA family outer membrane protein